MTNNAGEPNPNKPIGGIRNEGELFAHDGQLYDVSAIRCDLGSGTLTYATKTLPTQVVIDLCRLDTEFDWETISSLNQDIRSTPSIVCQFPNGVSHVVWGFDVPLRMRLCGCEEMEVVIVDPVSVESYRLPATAIVPDWLAAKSSGVTSALIGFVFHEGEFKHQGYSEKIRKIENAYAAALLHLQMMYEANGYSPAQAATEVDKIKLPMNYTTSTMETKFKRALAPSTVFGTLGRLKAYIKRRMIDRNAHRSAWSKEKDDLCRIARIIGAALQQAHDMKRAKDFVGPRVRPTPLHRTTLSFVREVAAREPKADGRRLSDRDLVLVAVWSQVNPIELWPALNRLRAVCDFAVFVGRLSAGLVAELTPVIADQFVSLRDDWQGQHADAGSIATLLMEILDKAQDLDTIERFSREVLVTRKPQFLRGDPVNPPE